MIYREMQSGIGSRRVRRTASRSSFSRRRREIDFYCRRFFLKMKKRKQKAPHTGLARGKQALELDQQFCSAYNLLGSAYHSIGDEQASRKNFAKAFELKDRRLTQEENFQTTALYHFSTTHNLEKATAVLVLYKQVYPRSAFAFNFLGIAYAESRGVWE